VAGLAHVERGYPAPVAEHGDAIADPVDLVHAVGDVHDPHPLPLALPEKLEEPVRFTLGEGRRRLVQDQDGQIGPQRLGDLHHLLLRAGETVDLRPRPEREPQPSQGGLGAAVQGALGQKRAPGQLRPQKQVLLDRHVGHQAELLEHGADPPLPGVVDGAEVHRPALELDLAGVGTEGAGHDADEGGLARAVLPEEHVDLAGPEVEIHPVERLHAREPFAEAAQAEERRGLGDGRRSPRVLGTAPRHAAAPSPRGTWA
jgi:hypothetical protein